MNINDKAFEFFGIKSTNYQKNTILANYSSEKGGYLGISLDQNDDILEQIIWLGVVCKVFLLDI